MTLDDVGVLAGQAATFACEVFPDETLTLWFVNNQEVSHGEKFKLGIHGNKRTLTICSCTKVDTGRVTVTAMVGEKSTCASLTVYGKYCIIYFFLKAQYT
eukprot:GHVU01019348.1.p1 GENE.GHVU01019348.1~~GHVU01019348.1.p1  ORF type:complete len:100 (-),score=6.23 GHVU01019348.1:103-402(-)